jgi:hypothetical protein
MHVQLWDFRCTALVCNSVTRQQLTCMLTGVAPSYMLVYVFKHTLLCIIHSVYIVYRLF